MQDGVASDTRELGIRARKRQQACQILFFQRDKRREAFERR